MDILFLLKTILHVSKLPHFSPFIPIFPHPHSIAQFYGVYGVGHPQSESESKIPVITSWQTCVKDLNQLMVMLSPVETGADPVRVIDDPSSTFTGVKGVASETISEYHREII